MFTIKGVKPGEIFGEETYESLRRHYDRCVGTGQPVRYEHELYLAPKKQVWQTEVIPIFSKGGIHYLLALSKDVTELKRIQAENADFE